jgi:hypothetical protein
MEIPPEALPEFPIARCHTQSPTKLYSLLQILNSNVSFLPTSGEITV